jgi:hypothetical protein
MSRDLPIYDSGLRSRLQFSDLEKLRAVDTAPIWAKADLVLEKMEGSKNIALARKVLQHPSKDSLLEVHSIIFDGREGAGMLRTTALTPQYRGHDCPPPDFVSRSLDNFFGWLNAESMGEIHPIEKAAIVLVRTVDIWPFEFGNTTAAIMLANVILGHNGLAPFFVLPEHMKEFHTVIAQAMTIETQPLVNAIHQTIRRELEAIGR